MSAQSHASSQRPRRIGRFINFAFHAAIIAILIAWLIGRILTDRFAWSQWLWWIPTPVAIVMALAAIVVALATRRRRRIALWAACGFAIIACFLLIEHYLPPVVRKAPRAFCTSVLHWNVEPAIWGHMEPSIDEIIRHDADITVLTNPAGIFQHEKSQPWLEDGRIVVRQWPFEVASRIPIKTIRPIIHVDEMYVTVVEFEPSEKFNRPLVMYLVDLPSDPRIGRMAMMKRLRRMMDERNVPPPDVAVGDFNITRGSASLTAAFPNLVHAFDQAGDGYGATFHRWLPLWHIDHMLLGPNVRAWRYSIVHPGVSRHAVQKMWFSTSGAEQAVHQRPPS